MEHVQLIYIDNSNYNYLNLNQSIQFEKFRNQKSYDYINYHYFGQIVKLNKNNNDYNNNNYLKAPIFEKFEKKGQQLDKYQNIDPFYIQNEKEIQEKQTLQTRINILNKQILHTYGTDWNDTFQYKQSEAGKVRNDLFYISNKNENILSVSDDIKNQPKILIYHEGERNYVVKYKFQVFQQKLMIQWKPFIKGYYYISLDGIYIAKVLVLANKQIQDKNSLLSIQNLDDYRDPQSKQEDFKFHLESSNPYILNVQYYDIYGNTFGKIDQNYQDLLMDLNIIKHQKEFSPLVIRQIDEQNKVMSQNNSLISVQNTAIFTNFGLKEFKIIFKYDDILNQNKFNIFNLLIGSEIKKTIKIKFSISFKQRLKKFRDEISTFNRQQRDTILIDREYFANSIFEQSYNSFRNGLYIQFVQEIGIDAGGLSREFYDLLGDLMKKEENLFFKNIQEGKLHFHPQSQNLPEYKKKFRRLGEFVAHCILKRHLTGVNFSPVFWKVIGDQKINYQDMKYIYDSNTYNNFVEQLKYTDEEHESLMQTFSINIKDQNGKNQMVELIENGDNIDVNSSNCQQYVDLLALFQFKSQFLTQIKEFQNGFSSVFDLKILYKYIFPHEISKLTAGELEVNTENILKATQLSGENAKLKSFVLKFFNTQPQQTLKNFLKFSTGSSSINFDISETKIQLHFSTYMGTNKLPEAATCFKRINIPKYETYQKFTQKLLWAIEETQGFLNA